MGTSVNRSRKTGVDQGSRRIGASLDMIGGIEEGGVVVVAESFAGRTLD